MRDGRVLDGQVVAERSDDQTLVLAVTSGRVSAELRLPRDEIVLFDPEPSRRERKLAAIEAEAQALGDGGSAVDWWALAERCRPLDPIRHRELAAEVVKLDRHHAEARDALGFERLNGIWLLDHERAAALGEVYHEGRWYPYEEVVRLEREAEAREAARLAAREERQEDGGRSRTRTRVVYRSAYSYGCGLWVPNVWRSGYRGFGDDTGSQFIPSRGTRAAGGIGVPTGGFRYER